MAKSSGTVMVLVPFFVLVAISAWELNVLMERVPTTGIPLGRSAVRSSVIFESPPPNRFPKLPAIAIPNAAIPPISESSPVASGISCIAFAISLSSAIGGSGPLKTIRLNTSLWTGSREASATGRFAFRDCF